jgi:hypothetical protein
MKKLTILFFALFLALPSLFSQDAVKLTTDDKIITEKKAKNCVLKNAFGLDLGIGFVNATKQFNVLPAYDIGIRYLHNFSPYFGADFIKISFKYSKKDGGLGVFPNVYKLEINDNERHIPEYVNYKDYSSGHIQFLTGVRGNTPTFYKCMSGYGAFRLGTEFGGGWLDYTDAGKQYFSNGDTDCVTWWGLNLCLELEVGLNLTRNIFVGYAYSYKSNSKLPLNTHTFRVGFNFGR